MQLLGIIFIGYLTILFFIGIWTYRLAKTQEEYLLAGRKLGPWVTAFSERASGESAWLLLALPGAAIVIGMSEIWAVFGIIFGIISSWYLIAEKLRSETEKFNALTIPEYLHRKYCDDSNVIRLFSSIIISFFFLFYVSAQFHASGKVLNSLFKIDPIYGISIGAFIITLYTILGGFFAVAWTDLIQGVLMIGTLVVLPITGLIHIFQMDKTIINGLMEAELIFQNHNSLILGGKSGYEAVFLAIGGLSWGLGYLGQPHLLIRFMAIRSVKEVEKARKIAIIWSIPGVIGAFMIGLVALVYFGPQYFQGSGAADPEKAMPILATQILHPVVAGLFISGAVAAMMSTADSQLLVSASAITEDFIHQFLNLKLSQNTLVYLSRIVITILAGIAFGIALYSELTGKNIFLVVSYAWSGLGSAFGPALVLTLWWSKTTRLGVLAGLLTGFLTTVIWSNIPVLVNLCTERLASFVLSFFAVYVFSLITSNEA